MILTCSQQQKDAAVNLQIPQRLVEILLRCISHGSSIEAKWLELYIGALHALSSIASGGDKAVHAIIDLDILQILSSVFQVEFFRLLDAGARLLRLILQSKPHSHEVLTFFADRDQLLGRLTTLMPVSKGVCQVTCELFTLLTASGLNTGPERKMEDDTIGDNLGFDNGVGQLPFALLLEMLQSHCFRIKRAALLYVVASLQSKSFQTALVDTCHAEQEMFSHVIADLMCPEQEPEIRLIALNIIGLRYKNQLPVCNYTFVCYKLIPTVARLCRKDMSPAVRVGAAETMAVIIDDDPDLQELASYTDQLLVSLADYLKPLPSVASSGGPSAKNMSGWTALHKKVPSYTTPETGLELKRSAFLAFSSLTATNEHIRKRVADIEGLIGHVVTSSGEAETNPGLAFAAMRLLHSLSRSVQQLRTVFKDHNIWENVFAVVKKNPPSQVTSIATAILSNLSVEFSPNQQNLMKKGLLSILGNMLTSADDACVLNAIWTLMNLTYMATIATKRNIEEIVPSKIMGDLLQHKNKQVALCTIGLMRNLFYSSLTTGKEKDISPPPPPPPPDHSSIPSPLRMLRRFSRHNSNITAASVSSAATNSDSNQARDMMEWEYCRDLVGSLLNYLSGSQRLPSNAALDSAILEQGYCALGNVCATGKGQDIILNNPDAISLLKRGLQHGDTCVQSAAVFCICNLAKTQDDTPREDKIYLTSTERQRMLIQMNLQSELKLLLTKDDMQLFERVKNALQYLGGTV